MIEEELFGRTRIQISAETILRLRNGGLRLKQCNTKLWTLEWIDIEIGKTSFSVFLVGYFALWMCFLLVNFIYKITNKRVNWDIFCTFDTFRDYNDRASHIYVNDNTFRDYDYSASCIYKQKRDLGCVRLGMYLQLNKFNCLLIGFLNKIYWKIVFREVTLKR